MFSPKINIRICPNYHTFLISGRLISKVSLARESWFKIKEFSYLWSALGKRAEERACQEWPRDFNTQ